MPEKMYAFTKTQLSAMLLAALNNLWISGERPVDIVKDVINGLDAEAQLLEEGEPVQQTFLSIKDFWTTPAKTESKSSDNFILEKAKELKEKYDNSI